jgi:hypothetical protein
MGGYAVFAGAEGFDFFVGARFLGSEIVGREAEDDEALVLVLFVRCLESAVLRGVAALAGHVDDQNHFAFVVGERRGSAVDGVEGEGVDSRSRKQ